MMSEKNFSFRIISSCFIEIEPIKKQKTNCKSVNSSKTR